MQNQYDNAAFVSLLNERSATLLIDYNRDTIETTWALKYIMKITSNHFNFIGLQTDAQLKLKKSRDKRRDY